jgi:hypothetical protein
METTQNFLAIVSILLLIYVLVEVRRAHIRVEYSVSWFAAAISLLVLAKWPGLLPAISSRAGFESETIALLLLVGCLFLFVLVRLSIVVSGLKDNNIALAQRVAILEYRLEHPDEAEQEETPANEAG